MQRGYVKVWRKIEDSGLIQLPNTLALFMHLLLNATHKDRKMGTPTGVIELKRGQYVSGRIELASRLKQTEQQIRTSLKRLEELEIITTKSTNRFSIYTIENYNKYQDETEANNQQSNQQITNKQPADNQQITTKQELNNLNIKELKQTPSRKKRALAYDDYPEFLEFWSIYPRKDEKKKSLEAWVKEKPPIQKVLQALEWQVPIYLNGDMQYIPMATTYINGARWEDEPSQKSTGAPF